MNDPTTDHLSADPDDLNHDGPDGPGASTGLDRPVAEAGPVAEVPVVDPIDLGSEDDPDDD